MILISKAVSSACTAISRTDVVTGDGLTASRYNVDLNTVYSAANSQDGECIQSGTIIKDALDTTAFGVLLEGIAEGCKVTRTDNANLSIGNCTMAINGNFMQTATTTAATWGCTGCSAEATGTEYYVYAKSTSNDSTLTPLILTTAPGENGYDTSDNKVMGKFYNDKDNHIATYSVFQWVKNDILPNGWQPVGTPVRAYAVNSTVWTTLDISHWVGGKQTMVFLKVDMGGAMRIAFRPSNNTEDWMSADGSDISTAMINIQGNTGEVGSAWVQTGTNGKLEFLTSSAAVSFEIWLVGFQN